MKPFTGKVLKIGIALVLIGIIIVLLISVRQFRQVSERDNSVSHTNEVLYRTQKLLSTATDYHILVKDFVLSGDSLLLIKLKKAGDSIFSEEKKLQLITADNNGQQARVEDLKGYIQKDISNSALIVKIRRREGLQAAVGFLGHENAGYNMDSTRSKINEIAAVEKKLRNIRREASQRATSRLNFMLLVLILIVFLLIAIIIQTVRLDFLALRKAEKKLNEREEQFQLLVKGVKDYSIFMVDTQGRIMTWNDGATHIKGYSAEEAIGKSISLFYTPDMLRSGEPMRNLQKACELGHYESQGWRVRKDGSVFWADVIFTALYDREGKLRGYSKITRDITEQKERLERISYLSSLVEQTSDAIISVDKDYRVRSWNKAAEAMYGYTLEEALGTELGQMAKSTFSPEVRENIYRELMASGKYQNEIEYLHRDGHSLFVNSSISVLRREEGEVIGFVTVQKDITERKKLEDKLKRLNEDLEEKVRVKTRELTNIFERITDAFVALDENWNYTYVNQKAAEIFGLSAGEVLGQNIWQLFPDAVGNVFYQAYRRAMQEQQYVYLEAYYEPFSRWLENHIYPSDNGISIFFRDITDKKRAEQEIRSSNERFEMVAGATNDVVWDWDFSNQQIWWNNNFYSHYGYPRTQETLDISSRHGGIHPEDQARVIQSIERAIAGGQRYWSAEYRFLKQDGSVVYVLDRGYVLRDKDSKPYRMVGAMLDVTGIRKAEEQIINSEKRFRALQENSLDGLTLLSAEGKVLEMSSSGRKILGYEASQIIGQVRADLIHPEDAFKVIVAFENIKVYPAQIELIEYRHLMPDGQYRWLECSYHNLLREPYVNAIVLHYRDITERKSAEQQVRTNEQKLTRAQEIGQFGSWEFDAETRQLRWSDSLYVLFGLDKDTPATTELFMEIVHPDDRQRVKGLFEHSGVGGLMQKQDFRFLHASGETRFAQSIVDVLFENGRFWKSMGVLQDITDIRKAEETIRESEKRYRRAESIGKLGHWEYDFIHDKLFWSDEIFRLFDVDPKTFHPVYQTFLGVMHPEDREVFQQQLEQACAGGEGLNTVHRIRLGDGSMRYMHEIGEVIRDPEGQPAEIRGTVQDVTEKIEAENLLRSSYEDIRRLAAHLQDIREEERANMAREIHDELGQQLTGLKMDIHWLKSELKSNKPGAQEGMENVLILLDQTIQTVRKISSDLRPPMLDDIGLVETLKWYSREFQRRYNIEVDFSTDLTEIEITPKMNIALFRIYQESLTNVARHASASRVLSRMTCQVDKLVLRVKDNGQGFEIRQTAERKTLGILGMKERILMLNGRFQVNSAPGKGTEILVTVPLPSILSIKRKS